MDETTDYSNDDKVIQTKVGQTFKIKMLSVPTSGYIWEFTIPENAHKSIKHLDTTWEYDKSLAGGQSLQIFNFYASSEGTFSITFFYKRPWEKDNVLDKQIYLIRIS